MTTHVFRTMGTVASLRTPEPAPAEVLRAIEAVHEEYDRTFSLYRPGSPAGRLANGQATPEELGPVVDAAFERSIRWRAATHGAFTPYSADGGVDLMGIAKALAMERSARILTAALPGWVLNVGADLSWQAWGEPGEQVVGVADPAEPERLLCTVPLDAGWSAIATSGTAERGEHIRRLPGRPVFVQATVLARDVVTADVLATAVVAGGHDVLLEAAARPGVEVLAVTAERDAVFTDGLAEHVAGRRRGRRLVGERRRRH